MAFVFRIVFWTVVMSITLSVSQPEAFQDFPKNNDGDSSSEVLRPKRNDLDMPEGAIRIYNCDNTFNCRHNSDFIGFQRAIVDHSLQELIGNLAENCSRINASNCQDENCNEEQTVAFLNFGLNVVQWVCHRQQAFLNGIACWIHPFQRNMDLCHTAVRNFPGHLKVTLLRLCFERTVRALPRCTQQDQDLFIQLTNYVMDEKLKLLRN